MSKASDRYARQIMRDRAEAERTAIHIGEGSRVRCGRKRTSCPNVVPSYRFEKWVEAFTGAPPGVCSKCFDAWSTPTPTKVEE